MPKGSERLQPPFCRPLEQEPAYRLGQAMAKLKEVYEELKSSDINEVAYALYMIDSFLDAQTTVDLQVEDRLRKIQEHHLAQCPPTNS